MTLGYRISAHYKRVTIWYFDKDGELTDTEIFTPSSTKDKPLRELLIKTRIERAKRGLK